MRLGANGVLPGFNEGDAIRDFLFPAVQADKARGRDDIKCVCDNPRYGGRAPISLPTWGHIGEMRLLFDSADIGRSFFETDREASYKNLAIAPDSEKLAWANLRNPAGGHWCGFWHRTLLSGDPAAALHYNAFSRKADDLASKKYLAYRSPIIFDDPGCLLPISIARMGLRTLCRFGEIIHIALNDIQKKVGRKATSPALVGPFSDPSGGKLLSVDLTGGEKQNWATRMQEFPVTEEPPKRN